jgi:glycine oxidase
MMPNADVAVVGAGIIGLAVALELRARGAQVLLLERAADGERMPGQASWAAAGMLAADDPYHPPALRELSRWSASLYDEFLAQIETLSGIRVPYQTEVTMQTMPEGTIRELRERSVDPRQLIPALQAAVKAAGVKIQAGVEIISVAEDAADMLLEAVDGRRFNAAAIVHAGGAWMQRWMRPRKGQMMRVGLEMDVVHRAEHIYVAPRTQGPYAGTALIGATVEDAGFDVSTDAESLDRLRMLAVELVPAVHDAEIIEAWAGLRPARLHGLPMLGAVPGSSRQFVAGGHFRNGILLAPGSAKVLADQIEGKPTVVDTSAFAAELLAVESIAQSDR